MHFSAGKRLPFFAILLLILVVPGMVAADEPAGLSPPRVKPSSERTVSIPPYERISSSPWNSGRMGGTEHERAFTFSPDGKLIAGEDAGAWQIELWDVATGKSLGRFGRLEGPVSLAFSPDGKKLLTAVMNSNDICSVDLWDVATHKRVRSLDEEVNLTPFTAAVFSPDGKTLALVAGEGRGPEKLGIHLWDAASGDELRWLDGPEPPAIDDPALGFRLLDAVCFTPDGRSLVVVGDNRVSLWEMASGKERCLLGTLLSAHVHKSEALEASACVAISSNGRTVAVGCQDGSVRLFDVVRGQPLPPLAGHAGWVRAVWFAPDGKSLTSLGTDNKVLTWPLDPALRSWRPKRDRLPANAIESLWRDLLDSDPLTGYAAVHNLAARPEQALALLRERVKPVPAIDAQHVAQLVETLKGEDFDARKRAAVELRKLGDLALPGLRKGNEGGHFTVITRRMLERLDADYPTPEQRRALRALEVLELLGAPEAGKMLGELAGGAAESLLTIRAKAIQTRLGKASAPAVLALPSAELWTALADEDPRAAYLAMRLLWASPDRALPFLRERMRAVATREALDEPARIARLIAELDSDDFAVREKASKMLPAVGKLAEPALRKALASQPSPEARVRIERVLRDIDKGAVSPDHLRASRALEVLEGIGDDGARQALEALGKEAKNRWLKEEIAESLRRLRHY